MSTKQEVITFHSDIDIVLSFLTKYQEASDDLLELWKALSDDNSSDDDGVTTSSGSSSEEESTITTITGTTDNPPFVVSLIAEFGNRSLRERRDVFAQWLKPIIPKYATIHRHVDKNVFLQDLIQQWNDLGGTFCLYTKKDDRDVDMSTMTANKTTATILNLHNSTEKKQIIQLVKMKLMKLVRKWRQTQKKMQQEKQTVSHHHHRYSLRSLHPSPTVHGTGDTTPKLDLLIAILHQNHFE
jgi:hypothetical protein